MKELKDLVEDIILYTKTWTITEDEWFYNVNCSRKSENINNDSDEITYDEFSRAIREEILYDLVFNNGYNIACQMEEDYMYEYGNRFDKENKELELKIKNFIKDFKIERVD